MPSNRGVSGTFNTAMTVRSQILRLFENEDLNFLLTNRIPRRLATAFVGWISQIEQPVVRDVSIGLWRLFSDVDLKDAKKTHFRSMHDCFTRELKEGARPVDPRPDILVSPCDAIVGACGSGSYVTLRLTSGMYHRFHAPHDCRVEKVIYVSGDTWNVNPIALRRVERLFCKNERAVLQTRLAATGDNVAIVLVAAVLVASIRLHFLDVLLNLKHRGPNVFDCDACFAKGDELGWFQHGSTAIVFAPEHYALCDGVSEGEMVRVGQPLMRLPRKSGC